MVAAAHAVIAGAVRWPVPPGGAARSVILASACAAAGAETGALLVVGSPGEAPRVVARQGRSLGRAASRAAGEACLAGFAGSRSGRTGAGGRGSLARDGDAQWLVVPLAGTRGVPVGALAFVREPGVPAWTSGQVTGIESIAAHLGAHLENEQLHDQLVRALDEVLTLYGAGEAISSSLDLDHVLAGIVEISRRLTGAEACFITDAAGTGEASILASHGGSDWWDEVRARAEVAAILDQVRADGESRPVASPGVAGWCVGLKVRGHAIGTLEVFAPLGTDGEVPSGLAGDAHLLAGLATQAAIALENAKLYQAVREKEASLQHLVERMIRAQEEDRRRVAYDIHDGLAQLMVSAHQHLQTFGIYHGQRDARAETSLHKGLFMLQKSIEEVRKVIAGLRPSELDDFGLVAALQLTVQNLRDEFGWRIDLHDGLGGARLPASVEVTAYRIIQEALTNARRHGEATRARVSVVRRGGDVELQVQDWGNGFDAAALAQRPAPGTDPGHHVGIHGMRERAHLLGGTFAIESALGTGTTMQVTIPLDRPDALALGPADGFGLARVGEAPASAGGAVVNGARSRLTGRGGVVVPSDGPGVPGAGAGGPLPVGAPVSSGAVRWPGARRGAGGRIGTWGSDGDGGAIAGARGGRAPVAVDDGSGEAHRDEPARRGT